MSEQERGAMFEQYGEFTESIRASGAFQAGEPLQPTSTATTVRKNHGKTITTDGPFAETKEQLGGYHIIEASTDCSGGGIPSNSPSCRSPAGGEMAQKARQEEGGGGYYQGRRAKLIGLDTAHDSSRVLQHTSRYDRRIRREDSTT
jgi:hypothetical protein